MAAEDLIVFHCGPLSPLEQSERMFPCLAGQGRENGEGENGAGKRASTHARTGPTPEEKRWDLTRGPSGLDIPETR